MFSTPHPTAHTVPPPILFNAWKHHAGWVRERIASTTGDTLRDLAADVVVIGTKVMDLYTGRLSPWEVGQEVVQHLQTENLLAGDEFGAWVAATDGYRQLDVSDGSRWVLRAGVGDRYVHLHPARYSPYSLRVSGYTMKTAVLATALALSRGLPGADLSTVNAARREYLALPPMARLAPDEGVGEVLQLFA